MNKKFSSSLLVILMAALLFSCNKDISEIGVDVVGGDPLQVVYMDTVTIKVHSELIDSLRSDELSAHVLGAYKDPVFGTLNASVYSQVRLSAGYEDYDFGENPTLDSIVLYIKYSETEVYGDTLFTQNLKIYEVGEDMYRDSVYFSFTNLRIKYDLLGESSFIPSFDSIEYYENDFQDTLTKLKPITIHLTEEFGQRLLELDSATYSSNDEFLKEFKGLYITTNDEDLPSVGGGLIAASFEDDETYINLYYHNDDNDSLEFKYVTNFSTAHFSNFNHYEYLDADPIFYQQVVEGNDSLGAEMFYLQGLAGVRATIEFPYLKQMDDYYNYAINEAKLFIYNIDEESELNTISQLTLSHKIVFDSTYFNYYLIQDASSGDSYFGGHYNTSEDKYYFRITQHLQDLIEGSTADSKLRLEMVGGAVHANRLIAGGYDPINLEDKKMKLQIIYTKIDSD